MGPWQSVTRTFPPDVWPSNGPHTRVSLRLPPLVLAFTSPFKSLTAIDPPEVFTWALNSAGTLIVYLPSVRWEPRQDQLSFVFARDCTVMVSPSCENVTGRSRRKASSSDLPPRLTFRKTSTVTAPLSLVVTSIDPKSTSTTSLPPGLTVNCLLSCSSVSP